MAKTVVMFHLVLMGIASTTSVAAKEECSLKKVRIDAIFVIDGSFSIEPVDFKKGLTFVAEFVDFLTERGMATGKDGARVGVVEYSTKVTMAIPLAGIESPLVLKEQILSINQSDDQTYTGDALIMMQDMFKKNPRNETLQMGFVLTDGTCSRENANLLTQVLAKIHKTNVSMYALGIGNDSSIDELRRIAGVTDGDDNMNSSRVFQVDNYDSLETLSTSLYTTVCKAIASDWLDIIKSKAFILPVGGVVLIIIVVVIVVVVLWRLSILARRKYLLNQLDEAKNELSRSQSEINRLYLNPKTTVNLQEVMKSAGEGGGDGGDGGVGGDGGQNGGGV